MRGLLRFCCALLVGLCGIASAEAGPRYDPGEVARFFEDVAIGQSPGARIVKWTSAPTVRLETLTHHPDDRGVPVATETAPARYQALARQVVELAALTGLPMRLMPRDIGEGGDIVISIVPLTLMRALSYPGVDPALINDVMGPGRCFFLIWATPSKGIEKGRIAINSRLSEDHIRHCFAEELTQSMGLPIDSERLRPSVFNEISMSPTLSALDRVLVRTLYDPRMPTGANLGHVRAVAAGIVAGYLAAD